MATHKVIQDIEAEDKFLGPLTLKQFIFGAIAAFFAYLSFFAVTKGAAFLLVVFLPFVFLGAFLAIPWSSHQSTEIWVLAKLRFMMKPKSRIWDQAGLEELVTITVPKKIEKQLTNGLDQMEVRSRLKALADTIDTRGWAIKNATLADAYSPNPALQASSQRLIELSTIPQAVPEIDLNQYNDVLDKDTPVSNNFDYMIQKSSQAQRQQSLDMMDRARNGQPIQPPGQPQANFTPPNTQQPILAQPADEQALSQQLKNNMNARNMAYAHMPTLGKTSQGQGSTGTQQPDPVFASIPPVGQPQAQMTSTPDPDIINLAHNNDLSIETLARQAKKKELGENEVVISLR
jgi:hypothetical protein